MKKIPCSLQSYIEEEIIPLYENFDKAHQTAHAASVIAESLKLAEHYEVKHAMVYAIAAFHDLGLKEGRDNHHLVSAQIMRMETRLKEWFDEEEIELMSEAVEDHRASNSCAPRSIYGMIVAEADRDINPITILRRTIQYGIYHYPDLSKELHYQRFIDHLQEKYAEGGYLQLWIPESKNALQLVELRKIISDKARLKKLFDTLYEEEK